MPLEFVNISHREGIQMNLIKLRGLDFQRDTKTRQLFSRADL